METLEYHIHQFLVSKNHLFDILPQMNVFYLPRQIPRLIFELLNGAFRQELNKLFKRWDGSLHDIITNEHSSELYWDLVDFIKEIMKK